METRELKSEINSAEELPYNILDVICRVGRKLENSKLTHRALQSVQHDTIKIAEYLGVTELQASLFCVVFVINYDNYDNSNSVNFCNIGRYFDLPTTKMLSYYSELQNLSDKSILTTEECRRRGITLEGMDVSFSVADGISEAVIQNVRPHVMDEKKDDTIFDVICRVARRVEDSKLTNRILGIVHNDTKKIAEYLDVSERQAVVFCVVFFLNYADASSVDLDDFSKHLNFSTVIGFEYYQDLKDLSEKGILLTEENNRRRLKIEGRDVSFYVEETVCEAIMKNIRLKELPVKEKKTIFGLLNFVSENFFEKNPNDRVPNFRIIRNFERKEKEYLSIPVVGKLKELLYPTDRILFYDFCYDRLCTSRNENTDLILALRDLYGEFDLKKRVDEFKQGKHHLQKLGFVELVKDDMVKRPSVRVTDKGLEMILGEEAELYIETISDKDLIAPEEIAAKELFYSDETGSQIELLRSSLQNKKFRELQARLSKEKMPKGICALFYGYPGTGKTESVYQIAKATKRRIYHVDISQTKSCWFGESEKIIKEVFTKYKSFCEKCREKKENAPILLFNEADAIFSKRKDSNSSNVAQTENAIQNIILEQMEKLDGIMIATTNLENNFDSAFERRFLFKIKFEKPTIENRAKIWQNKIASLSENEATYLAENYDFSGGEIDNIVRKSLMQNIISGESVGIKNIDELCKNEKLSGNSERIIGFRG